MSSSLDQALDVVKSDLLVRPNLLKLLELGIVNEQVDFQGPHLGQLNGFVDQCPQPFIFLDGFLMDFGVLLAWRGHI